MTLNWENAYQRLNEFIKSNPSIRIKPGMTIIPTETREQFYSLFQIAREAFIFEKMPTAWNEAHLLSSSYAEVTKLDSLPKITEVKTTPNLDKLFTNVRKSLTWPLFNPLFDLLQGKITFNAFERLSQEAVENSIEALLKKGYQKWIILSLARLIEPDKIMAMPWDEIHDYCFELQPDQKRGAIKYSVPRPRQVNQITLGHELASPSFLLADIIMRSKQTGSWITLIDGLKDASWTASNRTTAREWLKIRNAGQDLKPLDYWPAIAAYKDNKAENIGLIGDFSYFLRPDVLIECFMTPDWYQKGGLDIVMHNHKRFAPINGTFIISRHPVPAAVATEFETISSFDATDTQNNEASKRGIFFIEVGYDDSKLIPIAKALLSSS